MIIIKFTNVYIMCVYIYIYYGSSFLNIILFLVLAGPTLYEPFLSFVTVLFQLIANYIILRH